MTESTPNGLLIFCPLENFLWENKKDPKKPKLEVSGRGLDLVHAGGETGLPPATPEHPARLRRANALLNPHYNNNNNNALLLTGWLRIHPGAADVAEAVKGGAAEAAPSQDD